MQNCEEYQQQYPKNKPSELNNKSGGVIGALAVPRGQQQAINLVIVAGNLL